MKERVIYKERKNTNCEKWDGLLEEYGRRDLLPVWVADMDFEAPSCVQVALQKYIDFNVYGYYHVPDSFYDSIISWEKNYQGYRVKKEWIRFIPGVVPAIYWLIQMWTQKEESVLIMPPVYYPFFNSIKETGRQLVECPLLKEDEYYIHQDIVMSGYEKVSAATCGNYDEYLITLTSASKSFNIAGFQCAYAIIPNDKIREDYDQLAKKLHFIEGNNFSYIATQAVYEHGRPWLEAVCNIVESNYFYLKNELKKVMPKVKIAPLEGTYLAWLDMSDYVDPKRMKETILDKCHLAVDFGELFGGENYKSHIRLNLATSRENIEEVVKRLQLITN